MPERKSKPKSAHRVLSREFKIGIVCRMLAGENVSALARALKMTRKDLYAWRDRFQTGGPEAARPKPAAQGRNCRIGCEQHGAAAAGRVAHPTVAGIYARYPSKIT